VAWPSGAEIRRALQNPSIALVHRRLRGATVVRRPDGVIPLTWAGSFAIVAKLEHADGRVTALRAFTAPPEQRLARSAAVEVALRASGLPYFVSFQVLTDALLVSGNRLPVLAMEWVEGATLDEYVRRLTRGDHFALLARHFGAMCIALERAGIAHGDLQHGNIMVAGSRLRLVDYDGVYVAALKGMAAVEAGHPAYQHPRRAAQAFDSSLDRFSQLVIYTSLRALAAAPTLVRHVADQMLFSAGDLQEPSRSHIFGELRKLNPEVKLLVDELRKACSAPPTDAPALSSLVAGMDQGTYLPLPSDLGTGAGAAKAPAWARRSKLTPEGYWATGNSSGGGPTVTGARGGTATSPKSIFASLLSRKGVMVTCAVTVFTGPTLADVTGTTNPLLSFLGILPAIAALAWAAWKKWRSEPPRALAAIAALCLAGVGTSILASGAFAVLLSGLAIGYGIGLATLGAVIFTEHVLKKPENTPAVAASGLVVPLVAAGIVALINRPSRSTVLDQTFMAAPSGTQIPAGPGQAVNPPTKAPEAGATRRDSSTALSPDTSQAAGTADSAPATQAGNERTATNRDSDIASPLTTPKSDAEDRQLVRDSIKQAAALQLASSAEAEWKRASDVLDLASRDAYVRAADMYRIVVNATDSFERTNGPDTLAQRVRIETNRRLSELLQACMSDNRGHQRMGTPTVPCPTPR
jgi:hypothetical protein